MASLFGSAGLGAPQLNKTPKKQPNLNITGAAIQGHPNWGTPVAQTPNAPKPTTIIGQAIAGHPNWGGGIATNPYVPKGGNNPPGPPPSNTAAPPLTSGGGGGGGGAAPPGPNDPGFQIPPVPEDETAKTIAGTQYTTDTGAALNAIQQAAIDYGDPNELAKWGLGTTVNPNSALAMAALNHQLQTRTQNMGAEQAGNFFTTVNQHALGDIDDAQMRAQLAGYGVYSKALGDYATAMSNAAIRRDTAINAANADERNQAIAGLPTATTTGPTPPAPPTAPVVNTAVQGTKPTTGSKTYYGGWNAGAFAKSAAKAFGGGKKGKK